MGVSLIEQLFAAGDALTGKFMRIVGAKDDGGQAQALSISPSNNLRSLIRAVMIAGSGPQPNARVPVSEDDIYLDAFNNLVTRGAVLTDEESLRDDFEGTSLDTTLGASCTLTGGVNVTSASGLTVVTDQHYFKFTADPISAWTPVSLVASATSMTLETAYLGASTSGTAMITRWPTTGTAGTGASVSVATSSVTMASGTSNAAVSMISRQFDFEPLLFTANVSVSQRIANQTITFGLADTTDGSPNAQALFVVEGTTNTTVKTRTSFGKTGGAATTTENTVTLPFSLTTATSLLYEIDVSMKQVVFLINGYPVAVHRLHVPDPYATLNVIFRTSNSAAVTNTNLVVDQVFISNQDQIEVANSFSGQAIPVFTNEETHFAYGTLTTNSTAADQLVLQLTVPTGRTLYVVGYLVSNSSATVNSTATKIGKNTITEPGSGTTQTDANLLDVLNYVVAASANSPLKREFAFPVRFATSGDVVKIAVTPSGAASTIWRASLQYILR